MDKPNISPITAEQFRDQLDKLSALLHEILKKPSLSTDFDFLREAQKAICSLNELSKL